ncbi:amidase family protein [Enterobacter cloacae complex sp. 2022EL-00788]|uniref:amidase family protein n=1 Tax=Enterobacter cloacae complex sp. 2022EL-00788 TaxID=2996512 RepID=UPI00226FEE80|nr:amidase family protein [Enterobacter cloacae complex sp. 2022EL-00788]MCY0775057.1 amidase family protein [Enterobacter cloacae complex sp. 2022EL-00788]
MKRLLPPDDVPEEIARRLEIIQRHRALNAILGVNPDAISQAQRYQQLRRRGVQVGPLHGVPLIVKDNIACAPMPVTLGCRALASLGATSDALVVQRLRRAGAIILARANMSEFAFDVRSRSSLGGDVANPLWPSVTAGGSSGGCAAAVAAGMADGALGTDTGGSIRIPCSYTGLVGLRPAFRRAQLDGVAPLSPSKDTVGPMVHSVEDAALLHAVIHGFSPVTLPARPLNGARFGVVTALQGEDEAQLAVWQAALHALSRAGATLVEVSLPLLDDVRQATCLSLYEFRVAFDRWLAKQPGAPSGLAEIVASGAFLPEFAPFLKQMLACDTLKTPLWLAGRRLQRLLRQSLCQVAAEQRIDGFLYPTVQRLPDSMAKMPPGCAPELAAISGLPAITLPCGVNGNGLPVGMEILSPQEDETALMVLALACERAFGRKELI